MSCRRIGGRCTAGFKILCRCRTCINKLIQSVGNNRFNDGITFVALGISVIHKTLVDTVIDAEVAGGVRDFNAVNVIGAA